MNPEPIAITDPVKALIMRCLARFHEHHSWAKFCEDLEIEIKKHIKEIK